MSQRRTSVPQKDQLEKQFASLVAIASQDPQATRAYIASLNPLDADQSFRLAYLYEALALDPHPWEDLFSSELNRLLRLCEANPKRESLFSLVDTFGFLGSVASENLKTSLGSHLIAASKSPFPSVRRLTAHHLGDVDLSRSSSARARLEELLSDSDWRVRAQAESSLMDQHFLPSRFQASALDKLRRRFLSWTDYV